MRISMLTLYLNFEKIPTVFDSLDQSSLTIFFQVRFQSKVTPRYLTVITYLASISLNEKELNLFLKFVFKILTTGSMSVAFVNFDVLGLVPLSF